jgi:hypothetical protein
MADFILTQQSPMTFKVNNLAALADWLEEFNYTPTEIRNSAEYARRYKHLAICVIYNNGTVLATGDQWQRLAAGLARRVSRQLALPSFAGSE